MHCPRVTCITDPDRIRGYLADESAAFHGRADKLYLPETEAQVADVVRAANASHTPLTLSAAGTSITGSRVPMDGGAVLSVERMVSVEQAPEGAFQPAEAAGFSVLLDAESRTAVVPPAITLSALDAILARVGLLYPPDPTELSAMMAGTVATNASGARSFHYGPTRSWVRGLRVVLPTGEITDLRRGDGRAKDGCIRFRAEGRAVEILLPTPDQYRMPATKNAAGLYLASDAEPIDLFIGSEGLLGVITQIEIALTARPEQTLTVIGYFDSRDDALDFVDDGVAARAGKSDGLAFLSLEYFDARALDFMRDRYPDIPQAAAAVLCEVAHGAAPDHSPYPESDMLARLEAGLGARHARLNWAVPGARREEVRLFRHALPEAVNEYVRSRVGKIGSDMAVPHDRLREMMDAYERESAACRVRFVIFGHIGDDHVHLNYLPEDVDQAGRARQAYARLAETAVALGGTISAEHGVGKKTIVDLEGNSVSYLQVLYGREGLEAIARVKKALDPHCILNVGNMVPEEMLG